MTPIILHGFFLSLDTKLLCQKKLLINPTIHIFYGVLIWIYDQDQTTVFYWLISNINSFLTSLSSQNDIKVHARSLMAHESL